MTFTIRQLEIEESIKILFSLNNYAFRPTPPLPDFDDFAERIRGRMGVDYYGIFENDQPQAVCSAISFTQNIRGQIVAMGGVANVATHPAARRKGYVRALMHQVYKKFSNENIGVSCLYPFQETFYQRLEDSDLLWPAALTFSWFTSWGRTTPPSIKYPGIRNRWQTAPSRVNCKTRVDQNACGIFALSVEAGRR